MTIPEDYPGVMGLNTKSITVNNELKHDFATFRCLFV